MVGVMGVAIPGSIVGMLVLFISLQLKIVPLHWVKPASDFLLKYLALFFVPFGVGLMEYFNLIKNNLMGMLGAIFLSTLFTLWITAWIFKQFKKE
nr:CidA/LrgA family protein [Christiangramia fulva]